VVREDQVLLIIPDLQQMQVKIGIHESKVDRVKPGMQARIQLQDGSIDGEVHSVSSITKPTGWWNGNIVKYDTMINLVDQKDGLKPGMSVAVDVFLARYRDVPTIPVAAVLQQGDQFVCWVQNKDGTVARRNVVLGDSNDKFMVVEEGLEEGDQVVLNPIDFVDAAQAEALKPGSESRTNSADPGTGQQAQKQPTNRG
jgi:HlyD family secretion protein